MFSKIPQEKKGAIVGRGTPWDIIARDALTVKRKLRAESTLFRCESGLGASGFPHIGSFGDGARAFVVKLAAENLGFPAEYISYSDDLDGLRKVPVGMSTSLEEYLGVPVSKIPDELGCHDSFGSHMSSLLLDALDFAGIEYRFISATEAYENGSYTHIISRILEKADEVGRIIAEVTSQTKYVEALPFHAICAECGRIYTTRPIEHINDKYAVRYVCEGSDIQEQFIPGCEYTGLADYSKGEGKLSWKVEFAARWATLGIDFEAYGKDILESVKVNDRICREILDVEPPYHVRYEVFLEKGGKKMSKSAGGALTPQLWFRYGTPQSLMLLMLKRIEGSRNLCLGDIPSYMDELDSIESTYFGLHKTKNEAVARKAKGLYEYAFLLRTPAEPSIHPPYNLLATLIYYAPLKKQKEFIFEKLDEYDYFPEDLDWRMALTKEDNINLSEPLQGLLKRLDLVKNWVSEVVIEEETIIKLESNQRETLRSLVPRLREASSADDYQSAIFAVCKENKISPRKFFPVLYRMLIGTEKGPRIGPLFALMGVDAVIEKIQTILGE